MHKITQNNHKLLRRSIATTHTKAFTQKSPSPAVSCIIRRATSSTTPPHLEPGLYIIGTPIGNLRDMTLRGLDILHRSDIIACEDPRHTIKLLNHYKVPMARKQLMSYSEGKGDQMHLYRHSQKTLDKIVEAIGMNSSIVALCSDAGMPCVSDPGMVLIHSCYENNIPVFVCPGPSATVSAVALSGFPTSKFIFEGFLSAKKSKRIELFETVKSNSAFSGYSVVFFESPTRILNTIDECISVLGPNYWVCVCSELTKKFEKVWRGSLQQVRQQIESSMGKEVRGEFTIVIAPNNNDSTMTEAATTTVSEQ